MTPIRGTKGATISFCATGEVVRGVGGLSAVVVVFLLVAPAAVREVGAILPSASQAIGPIVASISSTTTSGSIPLNVSFAGSATGGWPPYSYSWSFGDGSPVETGPSVAHLFRWVADFEVNLTVSDTNSQSSTVSVVIHALPAPLVVTVLSVPQVVHVGNTTYLESNVHGGTAPYIYRWAGLPSGCVALPVENLSCSPTSAGTFEVNLTVTDALGVVASASALLLVTGGSPAPAAQGQAYPWLWIGAGAGAIALAALAFGVWFRRRRPVR